MSLFRDRWIALLVVGQVVNVIASRCALVALVAGPEGSAPARRTRHHG